MGHLGGRREENVDREMRRETPTGHVVGSKPKWKRDE